EFVESTSRVTEILNAPEAPRRITWVMPEEISGIDARHDLVGGESFSEGSASFFFRNQQGLVAINQAIVNGRKIGQYLWRFHCVRFRAERVHDHLREQVTGSRIELVPPFVGGPIVRRAI